MADVKPVMSRKALKAAERPELVDYLGHVRSMGNEWIKRQVIENALLATGGNKAEAARLLGISRRALYNKLERIERGA